MIHIVGPQTLPTLLKAIAVRKFAYPKLIVHSPKRPRRTTNTREVDGCGQPSDLPTISLPPSDTQGFEPMTSALIPIVGSQTLATLLKAIVVKKDPYPSLIVHSPKCPRQTQRELMDAANPSIYQHI